MEKSEYGLMHSLEDTYWWYRGLHELVLGFLNKRKVAGPILDAGCGTGRLLQLMSRTWTAEGFDRSEDAIAFCRGRGLGNARVDDVNTVRLPDGKYAAITSMDVLYIREIPDDDAILRKFHAALAPGGVLLLNLAAFEILRRSHDDVVHTRHRYRRGELKRKLEAAGFRVAWTGYRLPHLFLYLLVKKAWEWITKQPPQSDLSTLPGWLNGTLLAIHRVENALNLAGVGMPVGSSVFAVAVKS